MNNDLLPCPFCGGKAMQEFDDSTPPPLCAIKCKKCHATIHFRPLYHAIAAWNTRAEPKALTAEELRELAKEPLKHWVWITNFDDTKESGYMRNCLGLPDDKHFNCGWPGMGYGLKYTDYGKTWLAYDRQPKGE